VCFNPVVCVDIYTVVVRSAFSRFAQTGHYRVNSRREKNVTSNSCTGCLGSAESIDDVLKILKDEWSACDSCPGAPVVRVLAEQYRRRHPQWWVVDGNLVVPIWIVEKIRRHRDF
jgi:hypothetical protein